MKTIEQYMTRDGLEFKIGMSLYRLSVDCDYMWQIPYIDTVDTSNWPKAKSDRAKKDRTDYVSTCYGSKKTILEMALNEIQWKIGDLQNYQERFRKQLSELPH